MVTGEEQEQHLDRQTTTPSSSATASSTPKRMATISPPVRPLETVAHEVRKSAEGLRVHGDDGGQKGKPRGRSLCRCVSPSWGMGACLTGSMWKGPPGGTAGSGCPQLSAECLETG